MGTITIGGHEVPVSDNFATLSAEEQRRTVDEIAAKLGASPQQPPQRSLLSQALRPVTDLPKAFEEERKTAGAQLDRGIAQIAKPSAPLSERAAGVGNLALGGAGYMFSPVNAAIRTFVGEPAERLTGVPHEYTDFAASLALPVPKRPPPRMPAPLPSRQLGVTLSEGQATQDLTTIQREQAAARGQSGPPAQRAAQQFYDQQQGELAQARQDITRGMDEAGNVVAETPREAGALAQRGMQAAEQRARAGVDEAYRTARGLGGEIHAGAFEGIGQKIKGELTLGTEPVIIDDKLTPYASRALQDIENNVARLRIQNRADPFGAPNPENIVGVNLEGVDQMRKRLSSFRSQAYSSGNASDGRAAQAVLDAFDNHIDQAVNGGLFSGDPSAVRAWNTARAAHSDYRATFRAGKNDPVGRVIEKITGTGRNPAQQVEDVVDHLYGAAGTNPSSLNVAVVQRLRDTLGANSPEWAGIKQGLFAKLTEAGEGMTQPGPAKVAERLSRFLNQDGVTMANMLYSPIERRVLNQYVDLMRSLEVPQAGANWSNTATFAGQGYRPSLALRASELLGREMTLLLGAAMGSGGRMMTSVLPIGATEVGSALGAGAARMAVQNREARQIARQMPIMANVMRDFTRATTVYERSQTPANVARLTLASRNLATNLQQMGISPEGFFSKLQGDEQQPSP